MLWLTVWARSCLFIWLSTRVQQDDAEELFKQWTGNVPWLFSLLLMASNASRPSSEVVMADTGVAMPAAQIARAWLHMARSKGLGRDLQGPIQMPLNREIIVKEVWQVRVGRVGDERKNREREREREREKESSHFGSSVRTFVLGAVHPSWHWGGGTGLT